MSNRELPPERTNHNILRKRRLSPEVYRRRRIATAVIGTISFVIVYQLALGFMGYIGSFLTAEASPTQSQTQQQSEQPTTPVIEPEVLTDCRLENIAIDVEIIGGPQFAVDENVSISATIRNTGDKTCLRDVGADANEIYIQTAETKREVWSSDRCPSASGSVIAEMLPGSEYRIRLEWNGTSNPTQCDRFGAHVPAGEYLVVARNERAKSKPAVISFI